MKLYINAPFILDTTTIIIFVDSVVYFPDSVFPESYFRNRPAKIFSEYRLLTTLENQVFYKIKDLLKDSKGNEFDENLIIRENSKQINRMIKINHLDALHPLFH